MISRHLARVNHALSSFSAIPNFSNSIDVLYADIWSISQAQNYLKYLQS